MKRFPYLLLWIFVLHYSCVTRQEQQEPAVPLERTFVLPEIPKVFETPADRAAYLSEHYWDCFDFSDTAYIHLPEITEQALVNFMDLMHHVEEAQITKSLENLLVKSSVNSHVSAYFWETMRSYWHDPNSPLRNDRFYILLCQVAKKEDRLEEGIRSKASFELGLTLKNRVGSNAADFVYTLISGKQGTLYEIEASYLLLLFHNPDCQTCAGNLRAMAQSEILDEWMNKRGLKVLTLYPDEDIDLWRKRLPELSSRWINAYDKGQVITENHLYDLSSIPSFYLLDKQKKVLLKDVDWVEILRFFENKAL